MQQNKQQDGKYQTTYGTFFLNKPPRVSEGKKMAENPVSKSPLDVSSIISKAKEFFSSDNKGSYTSIKG